MAYSIRQYGFDVETIIDVGVLYGTDWLYNDFPDATIVLIDPLPEVEAVSSAYPKRHMVVFQKAAGAKPGEAKLKVIRKSDGSIDGRTGLLPRSALTRARIRERRVVEVDTVDSMIRAAHVSPPFILKIDVEGYEYSVLTGCVETLKHTECVVLEISTKRRFNHTSRASRLFEFLGKHDFELFKVLGGHGPRRNYYDMLFVRYKSPVFDQAFTD